MLIKASTVLGLIIQMFLILAILLIDGLSADPILRLNAKIQHKLMYGDIMVPKYKNIRKASVVKADGYNRWPNAVVPYEMSDQYNDEQRSNIREALDELEQKSCWKFVERNGEKNYLLFAKEGGCSSYVGMLEADHIADYTGQHLSLDDGCVVSTLTGRRIIQHEVQHALGRIHEQQRPDRDEFIRMLWRNIKPEGKSQFEKIDDGTIELDGYPYDIDSIMHYSVDAFAKTGKNGKPLPTMVARKKGAKINAGDLLTNLDIQKLNLLGNCQQATNSRTRASRNKRRNKKD